VKAFAA